MKGKYYKPLWILIISGTLFTCVEPYNPELKDYQSLLVVDALLTDEDASNYVRLTRTIESINAPPEKFSGATVKLKDNEGNIAVFEETSDGLYKSDSLTFRGVPGRSYTLFITAGDGTEYESEPCTMYEVPEIDSLYFGKDWVTLDNGEVQEGVRVYIDSKEPAGNDYFRWSYKEWWKFNIPVPKDYEYVNQNNIYKIPLTNITCWNNNISEEILIQPAETYVGGSFVKKPVFFIPSRESNRLLVQYCVEITQYSLSASEFEFWDHMIQINDAGGDIFDKQPFPIVSNIHCISKPEEKVLGYFQVSSVRKAREYLTRKEVDLLDVELYSYDCDILMVGPGDPETLMIPEPITFDKVYEYFVQLNYTFVQPSYNERGQLIKLIFVRNVCADCTLTGNPEKPDFWVDL
ncbi:MAG: DUF4249 domain-containing protein [Bacteroidales bacterium]|jgi:hypothetical protein|nr:DUF4249 domain-containing protein [Bacteroidales bacterium]